MENDVERLLEGHRVLHVRSMTAGGIATTAPIHHRNRSRYIWVAAMECPWEGDEFYTLNPERLQGFSFALQQDQRCDICGHICSGSRPIYKFRCWPRPLSEDGAQRLKLHSFVTYASYECGYKLLGAMSEESRAREETVLNFARRFTRRAAFLAEIAWQRRRTLLLLHVRGALRSSSAPIPAGVIRHIGTFV
eukprot:gnl/TRDRNA2_/TRDRNA2_74408_c0_seq1.p1 gnl/TRDRNA2_/TRDRNA2_74408_c0~~gnl/TRDRNA2_/TRDRNA2_74408_c0_seq1.p1  ORF type:complete len:216 (+),score=17.03 gnl/TRDRNA2_/TRDRNA2_74408_c0_seq1:75-650(+)